MFGPRNPIGVDIGSHSVKVCQLRQATDMFELEKFGIAEIYPDGEQPNDPIERQRMQVDALKRALEDGKIRARHSISAVSGESIIVRYLQLPEMPDEELKDALEYGAEEYIPFQLSEVIIDSIVLGKVTVNDRPNMDVLLVSAKKDLVHAHEAIIRAAGLEPRTIDVDSFAFLNCFEFNHTPDKDECVALINIGGSITSINIYHSGVSRFSRDIPFGGDTMTAAIRAHLNCNYGEAERLKLSVGAPPVENGRGDGDQTLSENLLENIRGRVQQLSGEEVDDGTPEAGARKAIQNVLYSLYSEVRRSIEFFENQYRGMTIARAVLGGGTASLNNLVDNFAQELQLPVEIIDPLRQVRISSRTPDVDRVQLMRQQLGVGIGLGVRGVLEN